MSPHKIIKFTEAVDDPEEQTTPERQELFRRLAALPQDIAHEYAHSLALHFEDWLTIRNIILAIGQPETFKTLAETLPEFLYSRLNKIALQLAAKVPEVDEIVSATMNIVIPTDATRYKAADVIKIIKDLDMDPATKANELMAFARNLALLADTISVLNKGPEFNGWVFDKLSGIPEKDLDEIKSIATGLI